MLINLNSPISQWLGKWKTDPESTPGKADQHQKLITSRGQSLAHCSTSVIPRVQEISCSQAERITDRQTERTITLLRQP